MGAIVFLYFAFGLVILGFIMLATNPIIYDLKTDTDRWSSVTQYAPDFLTTRDMMYSIYQYSPFILAFVCGLIYVVVSTTRNRS